MTGQRSEFCFWSEAQPQYVHTLAERRIPWVDEFPHDPIEQSERHCISAAAFMVAGGGFEPSTFGLCDLTHLSMRVGLYLHPRGALAIQSLRLPQFQGFGSVLPYRSHDVGSTDFDE